MLLRIQFMGLLLIALAYTQDLNKSDYIECYQCDLMNINCGNRVTDTITPVIKCPNEHKCTTYKKASDNNNLYRGCTNTLHFSKISIQNGCLTDNDGSIYCFCNFSRCNAAGIADLKMQEGRKMKRSPRLFASLKATEPMNNEFRFREIIDSDLNGTNETYIDPSSVPLTPEYFNWVDGTTSMAQPVGSSKNSFKYSEPAPQVTENVLITNDYERIKVESTTPKPSTLKSVLDKLTETRLKIDKFIEAKNEATTKQKFKNTITVDYFNDNDQMLGEPGVKVGDMNGNSVSNRIDIIHKIEKLLDSMDFEELLKLIENERTRALELKKLSTLAVLTSTVASRTSVEEMIMTTLKAKLKEINRSKSTATTTTESIQKMSATTTTQSPVTTSVFREVMTESSSPVETSTIQFKIATELLTETPVTTTTTTTNIATTTTTIMPSTTTMPELKFTTTLPNKNQSTPLYIKKIHTLYHTSTNKTMPTTTITPPVKSSVISSEAINEITKTSDKPLATAGIEFNKESDSKFLQTISFDQFTPTELPREVTASSNNKSLTNSTIRFQPVQTTTTVLPKDPIYTSFEFLSTVSSMGLGVVPTSSTEAMLTPTKTTTKTNNPYDWHRIFHSEEYQEELRIDFKCKANGLFSHPTVCWKFIQCIYYGTVHERFLVSNCPSGLYFNEKGGYCDHTSNVDCTM